MPSFSNPRQSVHPGPSGASFPLRATDGLTLVGESWGLAQEKRQQLRQQQFQQRLTFVHGAGLTVQAYAPAFALALEPLTDAVRVDALNSRGHGGSDVPEDFPSWEAPRADLVSLVEQPPGAPVILAGHSFGALLSLSVASERPDLTSGLLLLDPLVPWPREAEWIPAGQGADGDLIDRTLTRREHWPSREEGALWLRERGVYRSWSNSAFQAFVRSGLVDSPEGGVRLACPSWLEAAVYSSRPGKEIFDWAETVQAPAVILRGRDSIVCDAKGAEDLADAFRMGAVFTIPGGHTFPQEHPTETAAALRLALAVLGLPVQGAETALPSPPEAEGGEGIG